MSRSGYSDDCDGWDLIRWRGAVASAFRGRRGQAFLKELLCALDALPEPKLISEDLERDGAVCALGSVGKARGVDMNGVDPYDRETVANIFNIAPAMAAEIMFMNDDEYIRQTPEARFTRMREWVKNQIEADRV